MEEKGEALLSRLARAVGEDTSITSVADYHNTFVTLRHQQPGARKPLTSSHIIRETVRGGGQASCQGRQHAEGKWEEDECIIAAGTPDRDPLSLACPG